MPTLIRRFSLASVIALGGCYHATIETGATPSTVVIDKSFASSWIYGLVPPSTVSTTSKCTDGVAKVETQHTFVNQLVGFLTLGIYTPMQIKVTCASRGSASAHINSPDLSVTK
jgi:Bor protein